MRSVLALVLVAVAITPAAAHAQQASLPNGGWCFGVKLRPRDRCANFGIVEIGGRFRTTPKTDHSTQDPAHAFPTLENHGYLSLGLAHRVADRSALGVVGEYGAGGGERQAIGVRFDQQLGEIPRLDLTAGMVRVETHQRGITRRRMANGTFVDAAVRASDLFVVQARVEHIPGDGGIVKPANATYLGLRVEGGGAVKTTIAASAILAVFIVFAFLRGDPHD